jgi:hypothetical protein
MHTVTRMGHSESASQFRFPKTFRIFDGRLLPCEKPVAHLEPRIRSTPDFVGRALQKADGTHAGKPKRP